MPENAYTYKLQPPNDINNGNDKATLPHCLLSRIHKIGFNNTSQITSLSTEILIPMHNSYMKIAFGLYALKLQVTQWKL